MLIHNLVRQADVEVPFWISQNPNFIRINPLGTMSLMPIHFIVVKVFQSGPSRNRMCN